MGYSKIIQVRQVTAGRTQIRRFIWHSRKVDGLRESRSMQRVED